MLPGSQNRKKTLVKAVLFTSCMALLALFAPATLHASSITYNLTLTPNANNPFGGSGTITLNNPVPSAGQVDYTQANGGLLNVTFSIDGQNFSLAGATGTTLVRFLNGQLNDITFAETIGSTPERFTLDSTSGYAFYYNNGQSASYGTFSVDPGTSPVPEPTSLLMLTTGLLGGAGMLRRKMSARSIS